MSEIKLIMDECIKSNYDFDNYHCLYLYEFCKQKFNRHKFSGDVKKVYH